MLFNSLSFLIFLPIVLVLFHWSKSKDVKIALLISASIFFYGWWKVEYVPLLLLSITVNYFVAQKIYARRSAGQKIRPLLSIGVFLNLLLLGIFKYTDFVITSVNYMADTTYVLTGIILPLAISFFTFQQIAYLMDSAAGKVKSDGFMNYVLFVSFFPQLIAGPIVHHSEMMSQFRKKQTGSRLEINLAIGLTVFVIGLVKKILIADNLAPYTNVVFSSANSGEPITFFLAWGGALAYTLQLYFDFSGYADMAIGIARMFGITLPLNFHSPYKASSIIEFWQRWHMTLSRFLKDYLYVPLGGNRKGAPRKYANLMITMVLGGLWHGAGWTFVIWGALHGVYLLLNHAWRGLFRSRDIAGPLFFKKATGTAITFIAVVIGWVFFRAESIDTATNILSGMFGQNGVPLPNKLMVVFEPATSILAAIGIDIAHGNPGLPPTQILLLLCGLLIVWCAPNTQQIMGRYRPALQTRPGSDKNPIGILGQHPWKRGHLYWRPTSVWAILIGFIFVLTTLIGLGVESPFLYFQF